MTVCGASTVEEGSGIGKMGTLLGLSMRDGTRNVNFFNNGKGSCSYRCTDKITTNIIKRHRDPALITGYQWKLQEFSGEVKRSVPTGHTTLNQHGINVDSASLHLTNDDITFVTKSENKVSRPKVRPGLSLAVRALYQL